MTNEVLAHTALVKTESVDFFSRGIQAAFMVETIKDRIQWILSDKDWSQRELARRAKLESESHVQRILKGAGGLMPDTVDKISTAAGVRYEWLAVGKLPIREVTVAATVADVEALVEQAVARATEKAPGNLAEIYVRFRIGEWRRANPGKTTVDFGNEKKLPQKWIARAESSLSRLPKEQVARWTKALQVMDLAAAARVWWRSPAGRAVVESWVSSSAAQQRATQRRVRAASA